MNMRAVLTLVFVANVGVLGCRGVQPYQRVDLTRDLSPASLARYEQEYREATLGSQQTGAVRLEHSNWWLPGLLGYYLRASVDRMAGPDGPIYHITEGHGYGPLCILLSTSATATYDSAGKRLGGERMTGILAGHLAMIHSTEVRASNSQTEKSLSMHLVHHILSIHKMGGHTYVSLLTFPNPIGSELGTIHGAHCADKPDATHAAPAGGHRAH